MIKYHDRSNLWKGELILAYRYRGRVHMGSWSKKLRAHVFNKNSKQRSNWMYLCFCIWRGYEVWKPIPSDLSSPTSLHFSRQHYKLRAKHSIPTKPVGHLIPKPVGLCLIETTTVSEPLAGLKFISRIIWKHKEENVLNRISYHLQCVISYACQNCYIKYAMQFL